MKEKTVNSDGFTIIELLIVLAIAGVIVLVVFLALPQLRLKIRNDARRSEAATYVQQVRECLTQANNQRDLCDSQAEVALSASSSGVYNQVIFCGSAGPVLQTGCGNTVSGMLDFSYMYNNGYDYTSSTTWSFFEVRYGHECSPTRWRSRPAMPVSKDSFVVMVPYERFLGDSYSKCYQF